MKILPHIARVAQLFKLEESKGVKIARGILALKRSYTKAGGDDTDFIYVTAFGQTAEYIAKFTDVGARIFVEDLQLTIKNIDGKIYNDFLLRQCSVIDYKKGEVNED